VVDGRRSQEVLRIAADKKVQAIVSYLSKNKWHVAKVVIAGLEGDRLYVEAASPTGCAPAGAALASKPIPTNIRIGQPVGVSFKYSYGKFVFDTTVAGLEPSPAGGGTMVLAVPRHIGVIQRRSYFRVNVPDSLKVNVVFWHRRAAAGEKNPIHDYHQACLADLSAGGAQIIMPFDLAQSASEGSSFRKGQFIGLRFTPLPYEMPLVFDAQIRSILPTEDHTGLCLGLQVVGLESSPEGRQILTRVAEVVEQYHQINESAFKQQYAGSSSGVQEQNLEVSAGASASV